MSVRFPDQEKFDATAERVREAIKDLVVPIIEALDDDDPNSVHAVMVGSLAATCELWAAFVSPTTTRKRLAEALSQNAAMLAKQAFDRARSVQ